MMIYVYKINVYLSRHLIAGTGGHGCYPQRSATWCGLSRCGQQSAWRIGGKDRAAKTSPSFGSKRCWIQWFFYGILRFLYVFQLFSFLFWVGHCFHYCLEGREVVCWWVPWQDSQTLIFSKPSTESADYFWNDATLFVLKAVEECVSWAFRVLSYHALSVCIWLLSCCGSKFNDQFLVSKPSRPGDVCSIFWS